jgi:3-hydroxyacyl-[acyl-carrier-protein] dehydratase
MKKLLNATEIQLLIPHRYPFQLIDGVIDFENGKEITAVKAVTIGEQFFCGHFPGLAIMPGVLVIEALAQATSLLLELTNREWMPGDLIFQRESNQIGVLGAVKVNMLRPVEPGCFLRLHAKLDWQKESAASVKVEAYTDDELCVQGSIVVGMKEKQVLVHEKSVI